MAVQKGWMLLAMLIGAPAWAGTTSDTASIEDLDLDDDGGLTLEELWTVQRSLAPRH